MIEPAMIEQALRSPTVLGTAIALALAFLLRIILGGPKKVPFPIAKVIPGKGSESLMAARAKVLLTPFNP